jgi:hypothetical protein
VGAKCCRCCCLSAGRGRGSSRRAALCFSYYKHSSSYRLMPSFSAGGTALLPASSSSDPGFDPGSVSAPPQPSCSAARPTRLVTALYSLLSSNEGCSSVARSAVARVVRDDFLFQGGAFRALRAGRPEAPAAHNAHTLDLGGGAGEHSSSYAGCRQAALPPPIFSRTAGCFGVADELVHFGDVCAL